MEELQDTFADLASFSLANEIVSGDNVTTSLFNSQYTIYIYIGLAILLVIIGLLIYKFNYVKRVRFDGSVNNNEPNNQYLGSV